MVVFEFEKKKYHKVEFVEINTCSQSDKKKASMNYSFLSFLNKLHLVHCLEAFNRAVYVLIHIKW